MTISRRDYFIAHAPTEPQPWFYPVMPPQPMRPKSSGSEDNEVRIREVREEQIWRAAHDDWRAEYAKQHYLQWPAAWADAMLEQEKTMQPVANVTNLRAFACAVLATNSWLLWPGCPDEARGYCEPDAKPVILYALPEDIDAHVLAQGE